jgi:hypothetical protein
MMKVIVNIVLLLFFATSMSAQENNSVNNSKVIDEQQPVQENVTDDTKYLNGMVPVASFKTDNPADSLHLPTLDYSGRMPTYRWWYHPWVSDYWGWELHEGLNMNVSLSAFTSFGKNKYSGTAERISAMYAKPINNKLSFAIGGYFSNINSGIGSFREAGVTAILDYRFNDHWEAYVFGQKSLVNKYDYRFRYGLHAPNYYMFSPFDNIGDRIGAGVRYNFNESSYIELQLDWTNYPDQFNRSITNRSQMPGQSRIPKK